LSQWTQTILPTIVLAHHILVISEDPLLQKVATSDLRVSKLEKRQVR